jgi:hypothetical protein
MITKETAIYPVFANAYLVECDSTCDDSDVYLRSIKAIKESHQYDLGDFVGELIYCGGNWVEVKLADGRRAYGKAHLFHC